MMFHGLTGHRDGYIGSHEIVEALELFVREVIADERKPKLAGEVVEKTMAELDVEP